MIPETIGRYLVQAELGRGGMATVYRAVDPRFKRDVAIKVLPRQFLHDPSFRTRFEREAQTIAALEHPAIVPVYDFGEDNEQPYLVMRLMTGGTLAEKLHLGALSLTQVAAILGWLAPALDEAHRQGIIHRDLKPSNILFDQWDKAYLSDFGIVKLVEGSGATLTDTSTALGTPAYMSPEQVLGEGKLDSRSDIYAFGVIFFEMLTGKKPYVADTPMGQALKHVTDTIPHVQKFNPSLPPECQVIVSKAMAKDRGKRYQTAVELAAAILPIAGITPSAEILVWSEIKTPPPPFPAPPTAGDNEAATASLIVEKSKQPAVTSKPFAGGEKEAATNRPLVIPHQPSPDPTLVPTRTPTPAIGRGIKPVAILPPDPARINTPTPRVAAAPPTASSPRRLPWFIGGGLLVILLIVIGVILLNNNPTNGETITVTSLAIQQPPPTLKFTLEPRTTNTPTTAAAPPTPELVTSPTLRPVISLPNLPLSPDNLTQVRAITTWGRGIPNEVAFSPAGDHLAIATTNGLFIYLVTGGRVQVPPLYTLAPETVINTLAYSPDGTLIATGDTDRQVILWDAVTGEQKQVLEGHENWIRAVAFAPDGTLLASASSDTTVRLWPLQNGLAGEGQELSGFDTTVWGVAIAPDSQTVAVGLNDNTIRLIERANPDNRRTLEGHSGRVFGVTFSADGSQLASASSDGTARLWNVATGETIRTFEGHIGWLRSVDFMPDGNRVVTASYDGTARLWNIADGETSATLFGHLGLVVHATVTPNGAIIATASADGTVRLWQGENGEALGSIQDGTGRVLTVAVDESGRFAAAGSFDGSVRMWQLATGEPVYYLTDHQDWVRAVTFAPQGEYLATGSDDHTVRLIVVETGETALQLTGHTSLIRSLAFSPTGNRLFVGMGDGSVWVWSLTDTPVSHIEILPPQPEGALSVAFSPDSSLIATGTETGQVRLWRTSDSTLLHDLAGHTDRVNALAFSPDGAFLVSAAADGTVRLWRTNDGQNQTLWQPPAEEPIVFTGLGYSPDGQLLLAGTETGEIYWLNPTNDQVWQILDEHSDNVRMFAFTTSQTVLLSGSDDGTIVFWGVQEP